MSFGANNWQWLIPLIVGVVALVLAVSPALQMMFGKPRIMIGAPKPRNLGGDNYWQYSIKNDPIKNKALRYIGVSRRTAEGVISVCQITNCQDRTKRYRFMPKIKDYEGGGLKQRVNIPAGNSSVDVSFLVVKRIGDVVILDENITKLEAGEYCLEMSAICEGKIHYKKGYFTISDREPYCRWETTSCTNQVAI